MIYVFAADSDDARQWALFNGHTGAEFRFVGRWWEGMTLSVTDRVIRTARHMEHPDAHLRERALDRILAKTRLTESVHGGLVRQDA